MLKQLTHRFSSEARTQRRQERDEYNAQQWRKRQSEMEAVAEAFRQKEALQNAVLAALADGKVPDLGLQVNVPFKLMKGERWLLAVPNVSYAEIKVKREIRGRSAGASVRVMKGVSVRTGASRGTPVETDVLTPRGSGLFAVSTKHVFFHGERSFRIPHGKIVSVQSTSSKGLELEIVRDRASALPEYFGIGNDSEFVVELIHLLPEVNFGKGEPQIQSMEHYMLTDGVGADDVLDHD